MNCPHCGHSTREHLAQADSIARYAVPFGYGCQVAGCACIEERPPASFADRLAMTWEVLRTLPELVKRYRRHPTIMPEAIGLEARQSIRRIWRWQ